MSDKKYYTEEEINLAITAAIASTDVSKCNSIDEWQHNVIKRAASIQRARFFNEDSLIRKVLGATKIVAKVNAISFEESSQRYLITFTAENNQEPVQETIRSPRMDSYEGKNMEKEIERLKTIAGTDALVCLYKSNTMPTEAQIAEARKQGKMVPSNGYRNIVWVEFL